MTFCFCLFILMFPFIIAGVVTVDAAFMKGAADMITFTSSAYQSKCQQQPLILHMSGLFGEQPKPISEKKNKNKSVKTVSGSWVIAYCSGIDSNKFLPKNQ